MFRRSSLLRLIDVCFIILIGFIAITDRHLKVQLDYPTTGESADTTQVLSLLEVYVDADSSRVLSELRYLRDNSRERDGSRKQELSPIPASVYRLAWETDSVMVQIPNLTEDDLSGALNKVRSQYTNIEQVAIFPHDNSRLKGTVLVYDVCKKLCLPDPAIDLETASVP